MSQRPAADSHIGALLDIVWQAGGTDLLLTVGMQPQMRVNGNLNPLPGYGPLTGEHTDNLLAELLSPGQLANWRTTGELDFSFDRHDARIRANAFSQRGFTALALRMIPHRVPTLTELGMTQLIPFCRSHQGLVLVTGPTGSGKSTTLAAMINQINAERACHIVTIEDPIEYVHEHHRAMVNQREVGTDTQSFASALRSALRGDPDVLLVGEMRDLESIAAALTIAETGHLVLSTLHTNDAAQTLARIVDVFPAEQQAQVRTQLAAALSGIVYQRLIPRIGGGVVAAQEVLVATPAIRNLIKEGKTHLMRNALLTGRQDGMVTFEHSVSMLIRAGLVTYEDAAARSLYPKDIDAPLMAGARV
ncbi:MAG TPA: type IV pilus twitching motility protein PilT [Rugosimonospora sp.]|nr:type IV pilus twitching motility protein PilT [Rugosimonospora sp.]